MTQTFVPYNKPGAPAQEDHRVMKFEPVAPHIMAQCEKFVVRKDMIAGLIKKGTLVYGLKRFKIYVPKPNTDPSIAPTDPPDFVAEFNVDGQTFDDYFKPFVPLVVADEEGKA